MNPWRLQYPSTYPEGSAADLGPQESVQFLTQRAREALGVQREAARCALLRQQGEFLAATHQHDSAARQNLVKILASNNAAH